MTHSGIKRINYLISNNAVQYGFNIFQTMSFVDDHRRPFETRKEVRIVHEKLKHKIFNFVKKLPA